MCASSHRRDAVGLNRRDEPEGATQTKNSIPYVFAAMLGGFKPVAQVSAASADLSKAYCRSPQAAIDVLVQAKRDHVLQSPLVAAKAQFVSHDRIQAKDVCFFEKGAGSLFEVRRTPNGGLRLRFAD